MTNRCPVVATNFGHFGIHVRESVRLCVIARQSSNGWMDFQHAKLRAGFGNDDESPVTPHFGIEK